ncbi:MULTISPECIES: leucyl/phenylalanyl-tRNA--protein transferase [Arthrospira]|uniref:Leucyl/phenylalanyl-tRNA--protein transferase n=1 Tax=Limnospira platensis NIES-46 TaxID=1236695 RepID=A0A5M3T1F3_LIMPL|nr:MULTISPECIES: leucyl/phenylalanyl-tRNA--protein transferase [Arthrospira]AMW28897.1 leucyl/phenylalanyl-tRNA--protein transferase [Arthrospira platensis YZ]KDR56018.1 leucyl/phenylalanyl-tRNA--protein transferase [Arthrospira platensis str. Paraca]MBD2711485.1 leucyl/phenylalanyl-tRNA--protein transferase [Arthrospira platensis FACHB-835]MDF2212651.1 leucyl/phenylalanyl-tRNA--protein transferase [Arthrospira platensis NCB002]MDT9183941.1 leucyl/phenylalanyl-tRNA--protein transferase [Limnos
MQYDISAIIEGYAQGYFLMANDGEDSLGWYSSHQRALIPLDQRFHYPRSLQRFLNQNRFQVAINRDFEAVIQGCADRENTWISGELKRIYRLLNSQGWAYSFETWEGDRLAGGILGIAIGGAFIGESMFFNIPNGSKVAMVKLVEHLRKRDFVLFDAQMTNPHLERFGAFIISKNQYNQLLSKALKRKCFFADNSPRTFNDSQ